jgi:predicted MPP superfamily phosphohydrolase
MKNQWVIPDIHGCFKTMKTLIEKQIMPDKKDTLFFLGDFIDRGPDSKSVIDYIRTMQNDGYQLRLLLGNHEDYCVQAVNAEHNRKRFFGLKEANRIKKEWEKYGGKEAQDSFGLTDLRDFPAEYIDWMRDLEYFIELDDFILVHAGLNFEIENPFTDKRAMLWLREFKVNPSKIKNKTVVHGHVPVSLEFIDMSLKNPAYHFIDLDNGVYMENRAGFGNLVALELSSKKLLIQSNMDF